MNRLESDRAYVETLKSKHEILTTLGRTPDPAELGTVAAFEIRMWELEANPAHEEVLALGATNTHMIFALAIALPSLGITLGGMAVVLEHKLLWTAGLVFAALGIIGIGMGVFTMLS